MRGGLAYLDVIDRMNILHAILNNTTGLFQPLIATHTTDSISLNQNVAARQQLKRLKRASIRSQNSLSPFRKLLPVADHAIDLDDIHRHPILQDLYGLGNRDGTREQPDEISRIQDSRGIECFSRRLDRHVALNQIQLARNLVLLERPGHNRPCFADIRLAVLGELDLERRLLEEGSSFVVFRFELVNLWPVLATVTRHVAGAGGNHLPLVDVIRVPRLLDIMSRRHVCALLNKMRLVEGGSTDECFAEPREW